jgi:hypothetical protein
MLRIDEPTAARVRAALLSAEQRGTDPVRVLDERGLLHYPGKLRETMAAALRETAQVLEEMTVRQLAGEDRLATASADTKRHVVLWLRSQAMELEKP